MNLLEVAKHALEAMEDAMDRADTHEFYDAKESLRYAIEQAEQAEQKPVAWMDIDDKGQKHGLRYYSDGSSDEVPLYTAPTPRKPLTDEKRVNLVEFCGFLKYSAGYYEAICVTHSIEAAHGITGDSNE